MTVPEGAGPRVRLTLGLFLMALGALLALGQAGILHLHGLGRFWPLLLVGVGYVKARQPVEDGQRAVGVALLVVGGLLLLLGILSWGRAWPLAFVFLGTLLLAQATFGARTALEPAPTDSPYLAELAFIGGSKKRPRVAGFRGGYVTVVLGGMELDLRRAQMGGDRAVIDVVAIWGGIELKVPEGWTVDAKVTPLLGGFEDKTRVLVESDQAPRLVVRGYAIMGGVVVDN